MQVAVGCGWECTGVSVERSGVVFFLATSFVHHTPGALRCGIRVLLSLSLQDRLQESPGVQCGKY